MRKNPKYRQPLAIGPLLVMTLALAAYFVTFAVTGTINHLVLARAILPAFVVLALAVPVVYFWNRIADQLFKSLRKAVPKKP
ncbi:MAG TPA: hypothetical protein GXX25_02310 [Desulfotomaculum sp.]|nr:hypothetical protein [Desulfotomaculum sp.]